MSPPGPTVPRGVDIAASWAWRFLVIVGAALVLARAIAHVRVVAIPIAVALLIAALMAPAVDRLHGPAQSPLVAGQVEQHSVDQLDRRRLRLQAGGHRVEGGLQPVEVRDQQAAVLRPGDEGQLRLGDDGQRTFGADEQWHKRWRAGGVSPRVSGLRLPVHPGADAPGS